MRDPSKILHASHIIGTQSVLTCVQYPNIEPKNLAQLGYILYTLLWRFASPCVLPTLACARACTRNERKPFLHRTLLSWGWFVARPVGALVLAPIEMNRRCICDLGPPIHGRLTLPKRGRRRMIKNDYFCAHFSNLITLLYIKKSAHSSFHKMATWPTILSDPDLNGH